MDMWSLLERAFGWGGVLAYHGVGHEPHSPVMHVSPKRLRAQLEQLRDGHEIVSLRELVSRWRSRASTRNCVAITFDDAYAGVLRHALPILRSLDVPATVFVASNYAARGASYWWDDVERARLSAGPEWGDYTRAVGLAGLEAREPAAIDRIRNRVLARFRGRWPGELRTESEAVWRSLTFSELESVAVDERIDFAVHTLTHPALPLLSREEQLEEMRANLGILRERLPRVLPVVAYPYGLYNGETIRAATDAGMIAGVTMEGRATADRPNVMTVPRIGAGEMHTPDFITRRLHRALRPALVIRNRGAHPRMPVDPAPAQ